MARYENNTAHISVKVPLPNLTHLNWFDSRKSAEDIRKTGVFKAGDLKEVSESVAAYRHATVYVGLGVLNDPDTVVLVIGDGISPRTGALFAFNCRAKVFSIDPIMKMDKFSKIDRLTLVRSTVEEWLSCCPLILAEHPKNIVVIDVHSHAPLRLVMAYLAHLFPKAKAGIISIPCCINANSVATTFPGCRLAHFGEDYGIFSAKRIVNVFVPIEPAIPLGT
jgi:hypothetical protein